MLKEKEEIMNAKKTEESFVTIAKYTTANEANVAKSKLLAADIQCFIANENNMYTPNFSYVWLNVWEKDKDAALEVLGLDATPDEELDIEDREEDKVDAICPYCKSTDTSYGINRDKANTLFVVSTFFLQSLPWYHKKIYYCNHCHKHFKIAE